MKANSEFVDNNYTLNEYRDDLNKLIYYESHLNALKKCVAVLLDGYIIKTRCDNGIAYTCIKRSKTLDYFGFKINYKIGKKYEEKTCLKFIKDIEQDLIRFDGVKIMSSNPRCLSKYRPPTGVYLEGVPEKIISFFETRIYNPTALHEELSSHVYRLRHPNTFIEKCFVYYSPNYGNCGKSLLAGILGLMYPGFSNVAVQQQQLTSRFTGWAHDLLMLHVEELQNSNYRNHDFETIIKQLTTKNGSGERKGVDTQAAEHHSIIGFNTNQKDLYGLIRADEATISRLVILYFKPKDESVNWNELKTAIGLNDKTCTEQDALNLGYSMYVYLKTKYDIKHSFSPCRYYEQEKYDLINKLRNENKNSIDSWLCELCYETDASDVPYEFKLLQKKKIKGIEYTCIKNVKRDINSSYSKFIKETNSNNAFKCDSVIQSLIDKGFTQVKSNGINWLRIPTIEFEKLMKPDDVEEIEFDDDEDVL